MPLWIKLLRIIGGSETSAFFSRDLYRLALVNKVVLTYLSKVWRNGLGKKLFRYHSQRLNVLMCVLKDVARVLNEHGFRYVVFKTLRPFREEVADIDILCLGDDREYEEMVYAIGSRGYRLMERGLYCTTFEDPRYRFLTEVMIDIYREVSAGPLIYLDKELLRGHITTRDVDGYRVRVLDSVGEMLVIIGHSVVKERKITLADYLTAMHHLDSIDSEQVETFIGLVKRARLVYASRWFFTLVLQIYRVVHSYIPRKLVEVLNMLSGPTAPGIDVLMNEPPFPCGREVLLKVFAEKLSDPLFRASLANVFQWIFRGRSLQRIAWLVIGRL